MLKNSNRTVLIIINTAFDSETTGFCTIRKAAAFEPILVLPKREKKIAKRKINIKLLFNSTNLMSL
jgi:hypothetical protein